MAVGWLAVRPQIQGASVQQDQLTLPKVPFLLRSCDS